MKNSILYWVFLLFVVHHSFSQKKQESNRDEKTVQVKPIIYLLGGIVSALGEKEMNFAEKYHVVFHDFGCLAPTNLEAYEELNAKIFDLLNIQFGTKWQEEIKPTTLGFLKWKAKNK